MSAQLTLFIALVVLFFGLSLCFYLGYANYKRKKTFHHYLNEESVTTVETSVEDIFNSMLSQFTSTEEEINKKFLDAGLETFKYKSYYMHFKYSVFVLGAIVIGLMGTSSGIETSKLLVAILVWLTVCIVLPDSYLGYRKKALIQKTSSQLPYLLDLLAICVQTGMTLEAAISYLAIEMKSFDKNLAKLLAKMSERSSVVGLDRALDELYSRIPSPEMRSFVMTLKQSLRYGSSIYGILTTLAADIRMVNMLQAEEKIGKLAAKMSVPLILFIMLPIVFVIVAPGIMRLTGNV